jgi:hypothetical protein
MPVKKGEILNPKGKGGFGDNPQNRANGRWRKEDSIPYWQNYFLSLKVSEFKSWLENNPDKERTMAQEIAYITVTKSRKDLQYIREVTDRTSGKAQQFFDHTTGGEKINTVITTLKSEELKQRLKK